VEKALSGCVRGKLKKAKARTSGAETGVIQQPGNASAPKQEKTLTETSKMPRSKVSSPIETAGPPKRPAESSGLGNYMEALTNIKLAFFMETRPEDKLTEHFQESILVELGRLLRETPLGELPHLKSYRLEGGSLIRIYATTDSLVNGLSGPFKITNCDQGPD
jgi:hypothetical protein